MNQHVTLEKLPPETKSIADLDAKAVTKTVKALTLLTKQEQQIVPKMTAFIVIEYDNESYTVQPHAQVPHTATVKRSGRGLLFGIAAVSGG